MCRPRTKPGIRRSSIDGLIGLFGPKEMPRNARPHRRRRDRGGERPEVAAKIAATGQIVRPGGADEFAKEIEVQIKVVSDAAAAAGVKRMLQN